MIKLIDFENVKKTAASVPAYEQIEWIDSALKNKASYTLPTKIHISQEAGDYYNVMPCVYENDNIAMVKMIGRHSIKRDECRSVMMGDILLYEADTGILKAVMDAEYITTLRTGLSAAHSALLFTKKDFNTVGLIGLGNIMTVCIKAFVSALRAKGDNREITLQVIKYHSHEQRIIDMFKDEKNIHIKLCDTFEEVIGGADLVISAITKVSENFVTDEYFKEGVTVIPICTMGFQNCDLFFEKVFTDEIEQIRDFKYFNQFKSVTNVSDVLNGIKPGRTNDTERILVYNYGIAVHDLVFAEKLYKKIEDCNAEYNYCKDKYFV